MLKLPRNRGELLALMSLVHTVAARLEESFPETDEGLVFLKSDIAICAEQIGHITDKDLEAALAKRVEGETLTIK